MFASMGKKTKKYELEKGDEKKLNKTVELKFVLDERICDGFYYASSMRMLEKILYNPESLLVPPAEVLVDEGVGRKRVDK